MYVYVYFYVYVYVYAYAYVYVSDGFSELSQQKCITPVTISKSFAPLS